MLDAPAYCIFDVITDFLASQPTADDIILYRLPIGLQGLSDTSKAECHLPFSIRQCKHPWLERGRSCSLSCWGILAGRI